jgi:hypothetical protein
MDMIINIILFFLIVIIYLHITKQYRRSEDLEIFEMDYTTAAEFNVACELKQPMIFEYQSIRPEFYNDIRSIKSSESADVYIKESADYWNKSDASVDSVILSYSSARILTNTDTQAKYFSDGNAHFIEETGLGSLFQENNVDLQPPFTINKRYDLMFGSPKAVTPMLYHTDDRRFLSVHRGTIHVKMTPYKSIKYLKCVHDYDSYEFRSRLNVWENSDMERIKFLEFDVNPGNVLFIPPYWFYSIQYPDEHDSLLTCFQYSSVANIAANLSHITKYYYHRWQGSQDRPSSVHKKTLPEPPATSVVTKNTEEAISENGGVGGIGDGENYEKKDDILDGVILPSHEAERT